MMITSSLAAAISWLTSPSSSVNTRPDRYVDTSPQPTSLVTATAKPRRARHAVTRSSSWLMEVSLPSEQRLIPGAEPVDHRAQPRAQAIDQDCTGDIPQRPDYVGGLNRAPMRRAPNTMIGDSCCPLGVGSRIRHRSGRYVADLGTLGEQRLGVTGFAGAYASCDQDAAIRHGDVRIDQWGHR